MSSIQEIKNAPIEEKIKMLSAHDKEYLKGYMDHALFAYKRIENLAIIRSRSKRTDSRASFEDRFLGIDIGTSSVKVLAFAGDRRYKAREYYPKTSPFEHDPQMVAITVHRALDQLFEESGLDPATIAGIGMCGHGPSLLFVDKSGQPLTPIVTWQDRRAIKEASELRDSWPGFAKDGTCMEAKLLWFWRNHPGLFVPGISALDPKSYVAFLLCGKRTIDLSTASTIHYYNRVHNKWDGGATGIPLEVMPEVFKSWQAIGTTHTEFSRTCGLPDNIPVYPGGIDAFCESVGAGGFREGVVVEGSGTSTCISLPVPVDMSSSLHVLPDSSIRIEAISSGGACYKWFQECFADSDMFALTESIQADRPACLLFLPYLAGERSPIWDEKARGAFVGIDLQTRADTMLQAMYQGVGFAIRQTLESMGQGIRCVRAVGGANRNDKWLQIKANISGIRYERMIELDASAFGAALIAAIGSGIYKKSDFDTFIQPQTVFEPELKAKPEYDSLFSSYKALYGKLRETFEEMYVCAHS